MKIAIVGSGFTGLSAAYHLSKSGHQVTVYEKERIPGGLAAAYQHSSWQHPVERHYHHWFESDHTVLQLIKELGLNDKLIFPRSQTSIYHHNHIYPFNSPIEVLRFTPLSFADRLRTGLVTLFLKLLPPSLAINLEKQTAQDWIRKYYGEKAYEVIWQPLLRGKFGKHAEMVNMAWFWARIYKRTFLLGYLEGGYYALIKALESSILKNRGKMVFNTSFNKSLLSHFDKIIFTAPSRVFCQVFPDLPTAYQQKLENIIHLTALNLLLITKEKFLHDTYWLNINERNFPFIAVVQHTNLMSTKYYGNQHITYVGNYLPDNHPYLKMTKEQLFDIYLPYLKKINPSFSPKPITNLQLFSSPFAQPVFPVNYSMIKPDFITPVKNVYLANMDMVYPWDRGTNYAVELGEKVARFICRKE